MTGGKCTKRTNARRRHEPRPHGPFSAHPGQSPHGLLHRRGARAPRCADLVPPTAALPTGSRCAEGRTSIRDCSFAIFESLLPSREPRFATPKSRKRDRPGGLDAGPSPPGACDRSKGERSAWHGTWRLRRAEAGHASIASLCRSGVVAEDVSAGPDLDRLRVRARGLARRSTRDGSGMRDDEIAGRQHAPGRLHAAQLDVERDQARAVQRRTGRDALPLELPRATTQLLDASSPLRLAVRLALPGRCNRTLGRHAAPIRGEGRAFKLHAASASA